VSSRPSGPSAGGSEVVVLHPWCRGRRSSSSSLVEGPTRLVEGGPPHRLVGHGVGGGGPRQTDLAVPCGWSSARHAWTHVMRVCGGGGGGVGGNYGWTRAMLSAVPGAWRLRCWWRSEAWRCGAGSILSFGVSSCSQGGGELRCIGRNVTPALSVLTTT
jgi:hypothetical protein